MLVLLQTPPAPTTKRQFDRTGDHVPRSKLGKMWAEAINDGIREYEAELWKETDVAKTVETVSQVNICCKIFVTNCNNV